MNEVYLFLADGAVLVRRVGEASRLATPDEIEVWRADQVACWGCPATR